MAIRFRKSIKLAPGIRMNLSGSGSGVSWNLGPRGMSIGIGKRGTYLNAGLPGTGLSMRQALHSGGRVGASPQPTASPAANATLTLGVGVGVGDDGTITFKDETGAPVSDNMITLAKRQQGDAIMDLIQKKCAEINSRVTALDELHLDTPDPMSRYSHQPVPFTVDPPRAAAPQRAGFIAGLFKSQQKRIEQANAKSQAEHRVAMADWAATKERFEQAETQKQALLEKSHAGDVEAMEMFFGDVLNDVVWPRETLVSFEVRAGGTDLVFDVDLPEVEDMPNKTASVPQRSFRLSVREMGPTAVQKLYAQHIQRWTRHMELASPFTHSRGTQGHGQAAPTAFGTFFDLASSSSKNVDAERKTGRFGRQRRIEAMHAQAASSMASRLRTRCGHGPICRPSRLWVAAHSMGAHISGCASHIARLN
jgi:hypothetical protein